MDAPGIVFLMYHELEVEGRALCQSNRGYKHYVLKEADFRSQTRWLQESGWRGISVGEAISSYPASSVAFTFDDGSETDLIVAAPILREIKFGGTFYVTAGFVGQSGYMTPSQVRELSAAGFEIGCHSMTHAYLNDLDSSGLKREITDAKNMLEQMTGTHVNHFSCPGGRYDRRATDVARAAGFRSLATSRVGANTRATDVFALGRIAVRRTTSLQVFQQICRGQGLWKARLRDSLRAAPKHLLGNQRYDRVRSILFGDEHY